MNNSMSQNMINRISNLKFQLIINKNLYLDEVISKEDYELVENSLLEKINVLSNDLEMNI